MANAFVMVRFKGTRPLPLWVKGVQNPRREDLRHFVFLSDRFGPFARRARPCFHDLLVLARAIAIGVEASLGR